jgi:hypothetical protein
LRLSKDLPHDWSEQRHVLAWLRTRHGEARRGRAGKRRLAKVSHRDRIGLDFSSRDGMPRQTLVHREVFKIELRATLRAKALWIPLSSAGEATMLWIAWLRHAQGDEAAKRVLAWAIGTPLTVLASHEQCCVDTLRQRIDALAAIEREFSEAPQAKNPEQEPSQSLASTTALHSPLRPRRLAPRSPLRPLQPPGVAQRCASLTPAIHYMPGTMSSKF